ncbi:MAG TPA: anthranilate synthase component I [Deltaproteobacteria bacterium]|nr:MAG: anthranilate synthase component I [Deltaproteobacteria bacterium GWA2_55_82]OGQ62770.1 MAG: anthranilate synthase component I [Deltaproteobacteria bacterium RIFCSPLOWO2_02_FULL_55_12]OIJ73487.1 MAG: anthranilate synthase component I [Deltaproteobacteria bacterium GWC2_55_46]HBG46213.1 anthranilate synthase component I [Deltaproteobacteria bacterium]HCY10120.1 anthranilate synthase component I [Deltaproteobacteria bacterium]
MRRPSHCPSLDVFKELAKTSNMVPVWRDILADTDTPVSAFMKIDTGGDSFLLESVEGGEKWGRYSILGSAPKMVLRSLGNRVEVVQANGKRVIEGNPLDIIQSIISGFSPATVEGAPRFSGGAIGYMSYDIVRHIENLPDSSPRELGLDDIYLIFTDTFLVFDNVEHRIKIVSNAYINEGDDVDEAYASSLRKIDAIVEQLRKRTPERGGQTPGGTVEISSNFRREDFLRAVERVKEYIVEGDIFQAVISQRFSASLTVDPFDIYRALRVINPSPYMFFLKLGEATLVGSSPEILVRVEGESVNVKPIAGTRKRGRDEAEDLSLEKDLLADPKELSEHIMLVDLGRNDVGRVARAGTVEVDELMAIERYSHVMHIVSNVKGTLKKGLDSFDALKACFPAGTLTGAPKVRAMEIIEELEPSKREVYGGCVGYLGFSGNMDMCIAIRTMVIAGGRIHIQAGAGIVADSVPEKEFEETENKARGMLKAVEMATEGLF